MNQNPNMNYNTMSGQEFMQRYPQGLQSGRVLFFEGTRLVLRETTDGTAVRRATKKRPKALFFSRRGGR